MALHLIIDGYNLLGSRGRAGWRGGSEMAREDLLRRLGAYRHRKGHAVTVVFDGWRSGSGSEQHEHRAGVEVIYSRRGETADDVIGRLATHYGDACAVVSSDHEVAAAARVSGAVVLTATEFWAKVENAPSEFRAPFKELDAEQAIGPAGRRAADKKGNPKKLPKAQRQKQRQLRRF